MLANAMTTVLIAASPVRRDAPLRPGSCLGLWSKIGHARTADRRRPAAGRGAWPPRETRGSLLGVTWDTGRFGRLRLGLARAAVVRTGLAGHDLRRRPRRGVRPPRNDVLDSAAAGAGRQQHCNDEYRDDRHATPPCAAMIQALQLGQIRTADRSSGAAGRMLGDAAGSPIRARPCGLPPQ